MKLFEIIVMVANGFVIATISAYNTLEAKEQAQAKYKNNQIVEIRTIG